MNKIFVVTASILKPTQTNFIAGPLAASMKLHHMEKILLTLIFVFNLYVSFGQIADNTWKRDSSNVYNQAIIEYLNYLNKNNYPVSDTIYFFEDEFGITDRLMERINETRIVPVKQSEIEELVKKKKVLILYKLFPLEFENQTFHVTIVPFGATYNIIEPGLFFNTYGGYWINFKLNEGKFKFIRIDDNSI